MCLVLLANRSLPHTGILLAGNRDEFKSRPSAPPEVISTNPVIHAGRDLEAGGTWMGRNEWGLTAALTNRRSGSLPEGEPLSRGGIITGLLGHESAENAADWLASQPIRQYRPFNVLFGSLSAFYYFASEDTPQPVLLEPGFYALSNSFLDDQSWPKVSRCHHFFQANRSLPGEKLLENLTWFLGDSTPPDQKPWTDLSEEIHGALGAVFIRNTTYGTVSSTIITLGGTLGDRYYFAEGEALGRDPGNAFRQMPFQFRTG